MVIPRLVRQATAGEPLTVFGDGTQTRCFCHVSDVVTALTGVLDHEGAVGNVFNVGSQEEISMVELAERIIEVAGSPSAIVVVPYDEAYEQGFEDMARRVPDTQKLAALTAWAPSRTLDDILHETIAEARLEQASAAFRT
jgi:UDP-glucose 4-epimerase